MVLMCRCRAADNQNMRPPVLAALTLVAAVLTVALTTTAFAGRSSTHACPARLGVVGTQNWLVRGLSCAAARRVVTDVKAIRHSVARFARTRRCRGRYCIVVRGFRCRPSAARTDVRS
jgi:hypothetical protein